MYLNMIEFYCYEVKLDDRTVYIDRDDAKNQEEAEAMARNSELFDLDEYLNQANM